LQYLSGTVYTAVAKIIDAKFPKQTALMADATTHDSSGGYYEAVATGKRRLEPFEVTLAWDDSATSHAALLTAFGTDVTSTYKIADPDGNETIQFSAFVESIERISPQEDIFTAVVTFHPSGAATIT
jgi:predicted secreted protein